MPECVAIWRSSGLVCTRLPPRPEDAGDSRAQVAVGAKAAVRKLETAWRSGSHAQIGQLLGYPDCCRTSLHRLLTSDRDPIWLIAARSLGENDPISRWPPGGELRDEPRSHELRSVELLEGLGTGPAREALQTLAQGAPLGHLTRAARQALERLARPRALP